MVSGSRLVALWRDTLGGMSGTRWCPSLLVRRHRCLYGLRFLHPSEAAMQRAHVVVPIPQRVRCQGVLEQFPRFAVPPVDEKKHCKVVAGLHRRRMIDAHRLAKMRQ